VCGSFSYLLIKIISLQPASSRQNTYSPGLNSARQSEHLTTGR